MVRIIPSLDGLRAVSITYVILGHSIAVPLTPAARSLRLLCANTELAVNIFFYISGFPITPLLIAEHARTGRVSLSDFYIRRSFRIFPAFYCYLFAVLVLGSAGVVEGNPRTWVSAAS